MVMEKFREEKVWIVVGKFGRYAGSFGRRIEAKAAHAYAVEGTCSEYAWGRKLDAKQQEAWDKCAARGDRVIRATLTWEP